MSVTAISGGDDRPRHRLQGGLHRHRLPAPRRRRLRQYTGWSFF